MFIVGAENGRTPLIYHGEIKNEPEERNLFYVAMTSL
ncbi:3'-5' exonuclease [Candidatus Endomicrobiellum trichonymphae]